MLLTIAIPTYNRASKINRQIKNLCSQLELLSRDDICILIQDNHSTDGTEVICNSYVSKYEKLNITYNRNDKNLGFDKNVNLCMVNSQSKYTWILSDDDDLADSAILSVITEIENYINKFNFAFINYIVKSSEGKYSVKCPNLKTKLVDGTELLYEIELSHSFISSCVFEVESWRKIDSSKYFDSLWIHLLVARDIIPSGEALIISEPVITMNMPSLEESRSSLIQEDKLEFYTNAHIRISEFCNQLEHYGYSLELKKHLADGCRRYDPYQITNYKLSVERNSFKDMVKIAKAYYSVRQSKLTFFLFLLPLIFLPKECFKLIKWIKNAIK